MSDPLHFDPIQALQEMAVFQRKLAAGTTDKRRGGRPRKDAAGPVRAPDPEIAQAAFLLARSRAQESAVVKE